MQSIVPFFTVMISWLGFFLPKGMLPSQSTQTNFHSAFLRKPSFFVPLSLAQRTAPQTLLTVSIEASPSSTSFSSAPSLFSSCFFCGCRLCVRQWQTTFILSSYYIFWNPLLLRPLCAERLVDLATFNRPFGQEHLVLTGDPFPVGMTDSPK